MSAAAALLSAAAVAVGEQHCIPWRSLTCCMRFHAEVRDVAQRAQVNTGGSENKTEMTFLK
jgi:hypothetical protein